MFTDKVRGVIVSGVLEPPEETLTEWVWAPSTLIEWLWSATALVVNEWLWSPVLFVVNVCV